MKVFSMNMIDGLLSRKSVRTYTGEAIGETDLQTILKAGMASPIGMKQYDTVHITVISNTDLLAEIETESGKLMGRPEMKCFHGAPMYILVSAKVNPMMPTVAYSNASMVCENMLLAAVELGIGGCCVWGPVIALKQMPELISKLRIPDGFVPAAGIVLGKTNETYKPRDIPMDRIAVTEIK